MQSKRQSRIESVTNLVSGVVISLISMYIIFPIVGINIGINENIIITLYFTIISLFRSYIIRRYFNKKVSLSKSNNNKN
jgi:hypothetical protein